MQNLGANISLQVLVHHSNLVALPVLWRWGLGMGVPSSDWGHVMKAVTTPSHPSPPVPLSFHTSIGSLDPFY